MRRYVIASHGDLAKGCGVTLRMFVPELSNVTFLSGYGPEDDIEADVKRYFEVLSPEDEVVVLTDLMGGSVNSLFLPYMSERVHLVAGFNLALVLELLSMGAEESLTEQLLESVENAKSGIVYLNNHSVQFSADDDV